MELSCGPPRRPADTICPPDLLQRPLGRLPHLGIRVGEEALQCWYRGFGDGAEITEGRDGPMGRGLRHTAEIADHHGEAGTRVLRDPAQGHGAGEAQPRRPALEARGQAEEGLSKGLVRLIALAEQYPDLKANENFLSLQLELVETEDYLQFARRYYNGSVRELNTSIETVPSNFVAQLFGFTEKEYFQLASDEAAAVPLIKLASVE